MGATDEPGTAPGTPAAARRWPLDGLTVRARLALLYGLVSALIGVVPVGLVCVLVEHDLSNTVAVAVGESGTPVELTPASGLHPTAPAANQSMGKTGRTSPLDALTLVCAQSAQPAAAGGRTGTASCTLPNGGIALAREATVAQLGQNVSDRLIGQTAFYGAIALGILVLLAFGLGWWLAGRALRPVHRMAAAARLLSSVNLHERIPLHRPKDELRALGESFNALLDRLAAAFASQQRFAANVAHELRTPLTIQRATLQIGLADPAVEPQELAAVRDELLTANRRSETLIDRLLLLARSDAGLDHHEQLDLATIVTETIAPLTALAGERAVELSVRTDSVPVEGDPVLLAALVANLVQNALRYNRPQGRVDVVTSDRGLVVRNTGPTIAEDAVDGLFEPFQRLHDNRTGSATGSGLGLSIVQSIVTAHGGAITARPNRTGGGLTIQVRFPEPSGHAVHTRATDRTTSEPKLGS